MPKLSHRVAGLSLLALAAAAAPASSPNLYAGRWTVSDEKPVFSSKGILYKTVDIAPCGKDYCGVSVADGGKCGPVLFRFLAKSVRSGQELKGHGRWGNNRMNVVISAWDDDNSAPGGRSLMINLGNGYEFDERSGNMPKYSAGYQTVGAAHCVAK